MLSQHKMYLHKREIFVEESYNELESVFKLTTILCAHFDNFHKFLRR